MKRAVFLSGLCAMVAWGGFFTLRAEARPRVQNFPNTAAKPPQAAQGQATLYIFDVSLKTLVPSRNIVIDNGKKVGQLRRDHYLVLLLAPGYHLLWLKYGPKGDKVQLQAVAGQTYYAAGGFQPVMPASAGSATFAAISKADADGYLAQMQPMPPPGAAPAK